MTIFRSYGARPMFLSFYKYLTPDGAGVDLNLSLNSMSRKGKWKIAVKRMPDH